MGRRGKVARLFLMPKGEIILEPKKKIFHTHECGKLWMINPHNLKNGSIKTALKKGYQPCSSCRAKEIYQQKQNRQQNEHPVANPTKNSGKVSLKSNGGDKKRHKTKITATSTKRVYFEKAIQSLCNTYQIAVKFDEKTATAMFTTRKGGRWKMQYCEDPVVLHLCNSPNIAKNKKIFPTPLDAIAFIRKEDSVRSRDEMEESIEGAIDEIGSVSGYIRACLKKCGIQVNDFETEMQLDFSVDDSEFCSQLACLGVDEYTDMCRMLGIDPFAFINVLAQINFDGWC